MRSKSQLVQEYINRLPEGLEKPQNRVAVVSWFFNVSETGGLRLTPMGYKVLTMLKEPSWVIEVTDSKIFKNNKMLLALDKKLTGPYYIEKKKLIMFNSQEALLASLYTDLAQFLDSYNS